MTGAWPELGAAVAAHGLPGSRLPLPDRPVDAGPWAHLISCAESQRIPGLLARAIAEGALPVTTDQAESAELVQRASMATSILLERTLLETGRCLHGAGIDFRVLKGTAVAHLDYPDPSMRSFGDIDLLVRSSDFDAAVEVLTGTGHVRKFPEPRPGFDRRFGKGSCLVGPHGHEIDLHRTLAMGPFGLSLRLDDLWATSSTFTLAGREFTALGTEGRFLHACFHAALGDATPRLAALRDVAQMQLSPTLDLDRVRQLSSAWDADPVVARAAGLAAEAFALEPAGPLADWAAGVRPTRRGQRAMSVYVDPAQSYAGKSFAAVSTVGGWRSKAAFLYALVLPRRRYLVERREGRVHRWRRGVVQILRSVRGR